MRPVLDTIRYNVVLRKTLIVLWHAVGVYLTYLAAFLLRFDGDVPLRYQVAYWQTLPMLLVVALLVFALFDQYSGLWAYFTLDDLIKTAGAVTVAVLSTAFIVLAIRGWNFAGMPRSIFILETMLLGLWVGGGRLVIRYVKRIRHGHTDTGQTSERILLMGKLSDADLLLRRIYGATFGKIVAIVSDEPGERASRFHGRKVYYSTPSRVGEVAKTVEAQCILLLPPFNRPSDINAIVKSCSDAGVTCAFRVIPSLYDLATGKVSASMIRNVALEDLMGRGKTAVDRTDLTRFLKGRNVMVTGAGGSIGSELCRQIAAYQPACLVLFESSEFALYQIHMELSGRLPDVKLLAYAGDIRHPEEVSDAIDRAGGVDVIYHAAAYKHVPLMEINIAAAFRTNVLGTIRTARVARAKGVDRFVMISSDKAVRPTSIMGATKRLAEKALAHEAGGKTTFVSVRFGNVLESSGSVVPLFKKQIAAGGPVTVTTPNVRRFFMAVSEAVDLVLLAGTVGKNGDVMVLDMGEPVRVADLARRLIELSGFAPERDIKIEYIGLRPGEKEYEEVMTADENIIPTPHEGVRVMRRDGSAPEDALDVGLIESLVVSNNAKGLTDYAKQRVPENQLAE